MNTAVADMYDEEIVIARAGLSGKALREHLVRSADEIKKEKAAYRAKAIKDVGASRETIHTLANIARNRMHFMDMCEEWNEGKAGVRKTKIAYERLSQVEKPVRTPIMLHCWRKRPLGFEGGLRDACLIRYKQLEKEGDRVGADGVAIQNEITQIERAVRTLKDCKGESKMDSFFPGHGGFRKQQLAEEKVRAIERKDGGPMKNSEKYRRFPCLQPGWPDQLGSVKLDVLHDPVEMRKREQFAVGGQPCSPSLRQAKLTDQALATLNAKQGNKEPEAEEEPAYEQEDAMFAEVFGDTNKIDVPSDKSDESGDDESGDPARLPVSPSLAAANGPMEEDGDAAAVDSKRVRDEADDGSSSSSDEEDIHIKKRRMEIDGLDEEHEYADDGDSEVEGGYY
jgi:hypothetical protein